MSSVLTMTPTVASDAAGKATPRSRRHEVASPPSYRIAASATMPTFRASSASSKSIPPGPPTQQHPEPEERDQRGNADAARAQRDHDARGEHAADDEQDQAFVHRTQYLRRRRRSAADGLRKAGAARLCWPPRRRQGQTLRPIPRTMLTSPMIARIGMTTMMSISQPTRTHLQSQGHRPPAAGATFFSGGQPAKRLRDRRR